MDFFICFLSKVEQAFISGLCHFRFMVNEITHCMHGLKDDISTRLFLFIIPNYNQEDGPHQFQPEY